MHGLIIFIQLFLFTDYMQRIGRAGRDSDAVVITVCKSNQAIDYFYFENAPAMVHDPKRFTNNIPLGEDNPQILMKGLSLSFFDWLMLHEDPDVYVGREAL